MRISDWSSDVCSSDLAGLSHFRRLSMDWYSSCSYEPDRKRRFHTVARARLRRLAVALGFPRASFDLRSNQGGHAVSGELTLHHERDYVQVLQPAISAHTGHLIQIGKASCRERRVQTV